jgi:hypothetical protein
MTNVLEAEVAARSAAKDRRRPGRRGDVSPELILLLRGQEARATPEQEPQFGDPDQLRSARGIALAIALSAVLWAGLAYVGHWAFS